MRSWEWSSSNPCQPSFGTIDSTWLSLLGEPVQGISAQPFSYRASWHGEWVTASQSSQSDIPSDFKRDDEHGSTRTMRAMPPDRHCGYDNVHSSPQSQPLPARLQTRSHEWPAATVSIGDGLRRVTRGFQSGSRFRPGTTNLEKWLSNLQNH